MDISIILGKIVVAVAEEAIKAAQRGAPGIEAFMSKRLSDILPNPLRASLAKAAADAVARAKYPS